MDIYLAKTQNGRALFISKNASLYARFSKNKKDSVIHLQGAVIKPLQHYTKKQWKALKKEVKKYFPAIAYKELENMKFYLIMNWAIEKKPEIVASDPG